MFDALGRFAYRRRRLVLAAAVAFIAFALAWGTSVFGALSGGGFEDPDSESARATALLAERLGPNDADLIALYSSDTLTVDDPAYAAAVLGTLQALPREQVERVTTYFDTRAPQLVSEDRRSTYAVLQVRGEDEDARDAAYEVIRDDLDAPGLDVAVGGGVAINADITAQVGEDIARAEMISAPLLVVLLLVVFGSLAAASLPLAIGALAVLGAFTALRVLTLATDVSIFAVNIVTMLGLGLAIDYALFVVSRFREELPRHTTVVDALARTMATAGRTVAFSGLTVAISLGGLLLFPQLFLRSMGFGGIAAVLVAMIAALTVLPALLAVLGHRVDALSVRRLLPARLRRTTSDRPTDSGVWARVAHSVMRRPVAYVAVIVVVLLALGSPFLRAEFGGVDARALPDGTESREVSETLDREFGRNATSVIDVAVRTDGPVEAAQNAPALAAFVDRLSTVDGVRSAQVTGAAGDVARIAVGYTADPVSGEARDLVGALRAVDPPPGADVLVGGQSAQLLDLLDSLGATLPWMALLVVLVTFVLLFLAFGSVVLPVKAIVMTTLSLTASFGALVWIFQDGNLSGVLGFTSTGTIEATQPILMLAIAFGLSMDYEVFLLSRIREQWDRTGDNTLAVATGLQRTGRIITSAALLLMVVIGAFATSGITFIKMIGVGMIIAIFLDATVVRALLVPATMRLLGRANWYAPAPLRRVYERVGFHEGDEGGVPAGAVPAQDGHHPRASV